MTVSIVGVGLHPFGRFEISGREMGLIAARAALADAGISWSDVDFAAGGSRDSGHADALVSELGLTGVPFIGVYNGCGTAGSAILTCAQAIESGAAEVALAVGFDKHARGAVRFERRRLRPSRLVRRGRDDGHHPVLRPQDPALPARPRPRRPAARRDRRQGAAQRVDHPARVASQGRCRVDEIMAATMVNDPLTSYMFCSPSEGGAAVVLMSTERARQVSDRSVEIKALEFRTRRFGTFEVFSPWLAPEITDGATVARRPGRVRGGRHRARTRSTSPSSRTPRPAPS